MKLKHFFLPGLLLYGTVSFAQLHMADNVQIGTGGVISTTGNVVSDADVLGAGLLLLNGSSLQTLDAHGTELPLLFVRNNKHVSLLSDLTITTHLHFIEGKVMLNNSDLTLAPGFMLTDAAASAYIATNGTGLLRLEGVPAGFAQEIPVGSDTAAGNYTNAIVTNLGTTRDLYVQVKNYAGSLPGEGNTAQGIDRTWQISSNAPGDAVVWLVHNTSTEGAQFNRLAAFVTQWQNYWSIGLPNNGSSIGTTHIHSDTFNIPVAVGLGAFFSKSSNLSGSLAAPAIPGDDVMLDVAPNPFFDNISLRISGIAREEIQYAVTDIYGRLVTSGEIDTRSGAADHTIRIGDVPPGTYMLRIHGSKLNTTFKLIKN